MPAPRRSWALLRAGAAVGRRSWRPRKIELEREASVVFGGARRTLVQRLDWVQHDGRPARVHLLYDLRGRPSPAASEALMSAVRAIHGPSRPAPNRKGLPTASISGIDLAWRQVRSALAGRRPRPCRPGPRRWRPQELDALMAWLLRSPGWTPTYVSFRRTTRFRARGRDWELVRDGLASELDRELELAVHPKAEIPIRAWRRIRTRFVDGLTSELRSRGYRVSLRYGLDGGFPLLTFVRPLRLRTLEKDIRRHLAWRPAGAWSRPRL